ncbi:radical SAM/SPASM domain-containing protein [Nocardiopsis alba]|uniref:radical SAM/SPASM domain-containing protein n=1 Tax=Nocardiopsis alba TaxID=53437 RepID=UPI0033CEC8B2
MQTSPYLSTMAPDQPPPVRYLTDTFGPTLPTQEPPPPDTAFGVVGLDRNVHWHADPRMRELLQACAPEPVPSSVAATRFGTDLLEEAVRRDWLQEPDDLCRDYHLRSGEIEVTAHCNWGCDFCPVSTDPKPQQTMPMDLFEEVTEKLAALGTIEYVTFHFFNEPTLDKHFNERLEVLAGHGLPLALYTNASGLNESKIEGLRRNGVLRHLIVNLPTADEDRFSRLTRSRTHSRSLTNLGKALDAGFPVQIVVNGVGESRDQDLQDLRERYEPLGAEVVPTMTCDRAGDVGGEYRQDIRVQGRLTGCGWPLAHGNISVRGDLFLCCNDYYQREVFGNIRDGALDEIMRGDVAVGLRRKVFGVAQAADDFICRRCHNQTLDFPGREFRPIATFG